MKYLNIFLILFFAGQAQALSLAPLSSELELNQKFLCEVNRFVLKKINEAEPGLDLRVKRAKTIIKAVDSEKQCARLAERLANAPCVSLRNKISYNKNIGTRVRYTLYDVAYSDRGIIIDYNNTEVWHHHCQ